MECSAGLGHGVRRVANLRPPKPRPIVLQPIEHAPHFDVDRRQRLVQLVAERHQGRSHGLDRFQGADVGRTVHGGEVEVRVGGRGTRFGGSGPAITAAARYSSIRSAFRSRNGA